MNKIHFSFPVHTYSGLYRKTEALGGAGCLVDNKHRVERVNQRAHITVQYQYRYPLPSE